MTSPEIFELAGKRIWVAGHRGMAGSALCRRLASENCEILTVDRQQVDLRRQEAVERWLGNTKPQVVFIAAATVGGIHANSTRPAEFIYNNMAIETNIVEAAYRADVEKLVFLASSCIYPRLAAQPITEDQLMTGPLEPTNEWYALAKIAGIKLCQAYRKQYGADFISVAPNNLYGRGDNYDPLQGHVVAALLAKFHKAKIDRAETVEIWGTGKPVREFLDVDDMADAVVFLTRRYSDYEHINVGTGIETSILELSQLVAEVVGWTGRFAHNLDKPDGMPRKVMDASRIAAMGWEPRVTLRDGLARAYQDYLTFLDVNRV
ncbi:GDP-L-fucose synthase [Ferrovibrio terrae]|uniref:GDP-L-fucose synthase n=1 Tax=Ferrovibrio terrae TaxID=2594003 RepID=A0A516GYB8_9PROT|nr:GDP-L-fucose synthase [Ferrovibrio terrae]QDO96330.1 GDP-L-fucose synthase [Ferrovibrio terrae]